MSRPRLMRHQTACEAPAPACGCVFSGSGRPGCGCWDQVYTIEILLLCRFTEGNTPRRKRTPSRVIRLPATVLVLLDDCDTSLFLQVFCNRRESKQLESQGSRLG